MFALTPEQEDVIAKLHSGSILVAGVGAGKSIASLAYGARAYPDRKIIVITTAKKRNTGEWYSDAMKMSLRNELIVESWNKINDFINVKDAFFIFDEQKLVGKGLWVESFLQIASQNPWIVLSATPADTWMDLVPIFLANGFYRNRTEFNNTHVTFARYAKYPKVERYHEEWLLAKNRDAIYVEMPYLSKAVREEHIVDVDFSIEDQRRLYTDRWNIYDEVPLKDAGELMRLLRRSANLDPSRLRAIEKIAEDHPRLIIFYNHDPELEVLRTLMTRLDIPLSEWNGHNHDPVPEGDRWIYLVQYQAGAEAWNCVSTNAIVFYSLPYSWKQFHQAKGRIDRQNTKYDVLHYYILKSQAIIDKGIWRALHRKKNFQASAFAKKAWPKEETRVFTPLN